MSKTGGLDITPPPPFGEDGNPLVDENASIVETSMTPIVEDLMKKIEKLNSELSKLKAKDKKGKKMAPQVMIMIPHMKRKPPTKQRGIRKSAINPPIKLCLLITIICLALRRTPLCPLAKLLILMEQTIINESIA
jgi:hypothetical protein